MPEGNQNEAAMTLTAGKYITGSEPVNRRVSFLRMKQTKKEVAKFLTMNHTSMDQTQAAVPFLTTTCPFIRGEAKQIEQHVSCGKSGHHITTPYLKVLQSKARHFSPSMESEGDGEIVATLSCKIL